MNFEIEIRMEIVCQIITGLFVTIVRYHIGPSAVRLLIFRLQDY